MRTNTLLALVLTAVAGDFARAVGPSLCSQTSRAARHACDNQARDALWTPIGIYANTPDSGGRDACRRSAKREGRDVAKGCSEQFHAREDAPGIGLILEVEVDGGARNELVSFKGG